MKLLQDSKTLNILSFIGVGIYLTSMSYFIAADKMVFFLLPVIGIAAYLAVFSIDKFLSLIVFSTPLSIIYNESSSGISFALPTELLLFGGLLLFIVRTIIHNDIDKNVWKSPITLSILMYMSWQLLTAFTSTMPGVSIKFFIGNLWFIAVFYMLGTKWLNTPKNALKFYWLYIIPMAMVIMYTMVNHSKTFFSLDTSSFAMNPFFIDHGVYGAAIAFCIPFLVIYLLKATKLTRHPAMTFMGLMFLLIFIIGLIFSFTRAAWLSVVAASAFYILLTFGVKFKHLVVTLLLMAGLFFQFETEISLMLNKNKTHSSKDLDKHLQSVSNVRNDASNLERLNRWNSGFRMFAQKPLMGWGPGTYQFRYAPFQKPSEKTIISTNTHQVGGIHSEYFGPLVEMGVLGFLLFLGMVGTFIHQGMRLYYTGFTLQHKLLGLAALLGLITYFTHGALNNYFDTDKCASLVWGSAAIITALNVDSDRLRLGS